MASTTRKSSKASTTRKSSKAPAPVVDPLAELRGENRAQGFDTLAATQGILTAEDGLGSASALLADRLAVSPRIAAEVFEVRGAASSLAESISGAKSGKAKNAAEARISRIVKVGRVLAAHPTLDALAVYAATNRMTGEEVSAVVTAKSAEDAVKLLTASAAPRKSGGKRGPGKKSGGKATRTLAQQVDVAARECASVLSKAKGSDIAPAIVAQDLARFAAALESSLKATREALAALPAPVAAAK